MQFTSRIRKYTIDLKEEEYERWYKVINSEIEDAKLMFENSKKDIGFLSRSLLKIFKNPIGSFYKLYGGLYIGEMEAWADGLDIKMNEVIALNCQYELSHARFSYNFGCTAAAVWVESLGMVHLRNMDWELEGMGKATRIFEFISGKRKFVSVGVPGQIGILSGMLPKKYSITINYAPTSTNPWFNGFGPLFLLRDVLENNDTFDEAVKHLKKTDLATNVFFLVCGAKRNEACVIERTKTKSSVKYIEDSYITLGNHFKSRKFYDLNDDELMEDSTERENALQKKLNKLGTNPSLNDLANCLDAKPTLNNDTCQQMIFIPKTGQYKVWRWA